MTMRIRLVMLGLVAFGAAQAQSGGSIPSATYKPEMRYHGVSPRLDVLARDPVPVAPGMGQRIEPEMEQLFRESGPQGSLADLPAPHVQTSAPQPFAAEPLASFEGPGTGLAGFSMSGAPPDMTLAVGPDHIVAWVNSQYAVFSKTGAALVGPTNGNALFVGMGNVCESTNRGDPILQTGSRIAGS